MNKSFTARLNRESFDTIKDVFHAFVCMLTDEQLQKWHDNSVVTIRALNTSVDVVTEQVQQFIREETLKRDLIEDVSIRRSVQTQSPQLLR
jgi:hypothetical protein